MDNAKTLTVEPGTTVKFANNAKLEINGKLTAVGTSSNPITFQSVNGGTAKNQWYGIVFNSSADNTSSIKYATIKNARYTILDCSIIKLLQQG